MDWSNVFPTILTVIGSVGGVGVLFWFFAEMIKGIITKKISKAIETKYDKEIVELKSNLTHKVYVSQLWFDKEVQIFEVISNKLADMINATYKLFPTEPMDMKAPKENQNELDEKLLQNAKNSISDFNHLLKLKAVFIPEDIYNDLEMVLVECNKQLVPFAYCMKANDYSYIYSDIEQKEVDDAMKRTGEVAIKRKELSRKTRVHFSRMSLSGE